MDVTDEMVKRFQQSSLLRRSVRENLEAALADVPEPGAIVKACDMACRGLEERIAELEAQLEEHRALVMSYVRWHDRDDARIAELEAQRRATAKTLGAIIERLETQAADFAKVGNREGELLAETYRAYAADLRSLCGVESD